MATYTNIPTFTSGQVLTSAVMNDVKNNLDLSNAQSAYPYRNLIYNGAMQIAQRGTSTASITASNYYTADRWKTDITTLGTWTQSVENDGPTGTGLAKSLKMLCTTADASPAAGDLLNVAQLLEGFDCQRIAKGTSGAQALVLTFWVKSNVTGTYTVLLYDSDNNRGISKSYTISASATWEKKELTFAADTTGTLNNDNAQSHEFFMCLGAGSNFTSGALNTSWNTYAASTRAAGQTNVAAAINNYWQITGVQLEVGSVSTPFEFLPYGDDLARCQRYFWRWGGGGNGYDPLGIAAVSGTTSARLHINLPVPMRARPTGLTTNGTSLVIFMGAGGGNCTIAIDRSNTTSVLAAVTGTGLTNLAAAIVTGASDGTTTVDFTGAEL